MVNVLEEINSIADFISVQVEPTTCQFSGARIPQSTVPLEFGAEVL